MLVPLAAPGPRHPGTETLQPGSRLPAPVRAARPGSAPRFQFRSSAGCCPPAPPAPCPSAARSPRTAGPSSVEGTEGLRRAGQAAAPLSSRQPRPGGKTPHSCSGPSAAGPSLPEPPSGAAAAPALPAALRQTHRDPRPLPSSAPSPPRRFRFCSGGAGAAARGQRGPRGATAAAAPSAGAEGGPGERRWDCHPTHTGLSLSPRHTQGCHCHPGTHRAVTVTASVPWRLPQARQ